MKIKELEDGYRKIKFEKDIDNFKYENLFKKVPKKYKEIYKNRISFFEVIK